jgi:hypothetical protein
MEVLPFFRTNQTGAGSTRFFKATYHDLDFQMIMQPNPKISHAANPDEREDCHKLCVEMDIAIR